MQGIHTLLFWGLKQYIAVKNYDLKGNERISDDLRSLSNAEGSFSSIKCMLKDYFQDSHKRQAIFLHCLVIHYMWTSKT